MNDEGSRGSYYLDQARKALQRKDREQARYWAELASRSSPDLEEPWLILAATSSPNESIGFLKRALEVNPGSQRARKGMHWAIQRQRAAAALPPAPAAPTLEDTHPRKLASAVAVEPAQTTPVRVRVSPQPKRAARRRSGWLVPVALIVPLLALILVMAFSITLLPGVRAWAVFAGQSSGPRPIGLLSKPTLTPTDTPTPTATFTPTATHTPTFTLTPTQTPTATFTPTNTPTFTPEPTWTEVPTYAPVSYGNEGRWIDVNLSEQMVYAYDGDVIVNSFLVSTGTWRTPTVTGQYYIYVKYTAADMAGPGYYLPSVPYVMYFYKGYGLHGTYWHNNFGTPMSHGCINLRTPDAEWLFNWASIGTLVNIHY